MKSATLKIGAATLRIKVKGYSPDRWRVKSVTFNGKPVADWKIRHADIVKGGELVFVMCDNCVGASEPVASWSLDNGIT